MKPRKTLVIALSYAVGVAQMCQSIPIAVDCAVKYPETIMRVPDVHSSSKTHRESLQTRGVSGVIEDLASTASTSAEGAVSASSESVPTWREFLRDPNFKPEVREIPAFKKSLEVIRLRRGNIDISERPDLSSLSREERHEYELAQKRLYYYAKAEGINEQRRLRYWEKVPPPKSFPDWVKKLDLDVQERLRQDEHGRLVLSALTEDEKRKLNSVRTMSYYNDRRDTIVSNRRKRYRLKQLAKASTAAGSTSAESAEARMTRKSHVSEDVEGSSEVVRLAKSARHAIGSSPGGWASTSKRTSAGSRGKKQHSASSSNARATDSAPSPNLPNEALLRGTSSATRDVPTQQQSTPPPPPLTLKRLLSFDLNERLPDLDH